MENINLEKLFYTGGKYRLSVIQPGIEIVLYVEDNDTDLNQNIGTIIALNEDMEVVDIIEEDIDSKYYNQYFKNDVEDFEIDYLVGNNFNQDFEDIINKINALKGVKYE